MPPPGHQPPRRPARLPYSRSLGRSINGVAGRSLSLGRSLSIGPGVERPDAHLRDLGIRGFASRRHVVRLFATSGKQLCKIGLSGMPHVGGWCLLYDYMCAVQEGLPQALAIASHATPAIRDQMLDVLSCRNNCATTVHIPHVSMQEGPLDGPLRALYGEAGPACGNGDGDEAETAAQRASAEFVQRGMVSLAMLPVNIRLSHSMKIAACQYPLVPLHAGTVSHLAIQAILGRCCG